MAIDLHAEIPVQDLILNFDPVQRAAYALLYEQPRATPEEEILRLKMKIIEFEKFQGPIAQSMIEYLKRRIDALRLNRQLGVSQEPDDVRNPV